MKTRKLPKNWKKMTEAEQNSWSLTCWLQEELNNTNIVAKFQESGEFDVYYDETEISDAAVQEQVNSWFEHVFGDVPELGETINISDDEFQALLSEP